MAWAFNFRGRAEKDLQGLSRQAQKAVLDLLGSLQSADDPRTEGKALQGPLAGLWSYRVAGDYRVVCKLHYAQKRLEVVLIGNRRDTYPLTVRRLRL